MTLTPNPRVRVMVRVRFRVGKVRKPYPNFQMVPLSMTLSDLWPTFQGHDNIQRPITRLTVSRVWSVQWFRFQWPWSSNPSRGFQCHGDALDELCAQLTRDLFAIAKFLSNNVSFHSFEYVYIILGFLIFIKCNINKLTKQQTWLLFWFYFSLTFYFN